VEKLHGDPTVGHAQRSGPEVKMEEAVPKITRLRGSDVGQSRRWFSSCRGFRKRCKKNSPSVLYGIGKRTREGCDVAAEDGAPEVLRCRTFQEEVSQTL